MALVVIKPFHAYSVPLKVVTNEKGEALAEVLNIIC